MLNKFIESTEVCMNIGHPTVWGYMVGIVILLILFVWVVYLKAK